MATFYRSQTQNSFSSILLLSISITFFLLQLNKVNSVETISFEFTKFQPGQENLILQGDALITTPTGLLELTGEQGGGKPIVGTAGRALYSTPIHIWDKETDAIANFQTNFSFVINALNRDKTADGLAFFLAPVNTQLPDVEHGLLGIFSSAPSAGIDEPIVAVEFDTYINPWDPESEHIGIDVQSIASKKTKPWILSNREVASVSITYDATTTLLTVSLNYPSGDPFTVKERVDLSDVLDPWVRVGFSATSGFYTDHVEAHHVLSWSFHSELPDSSSIPKGSKKTNILLPGDVQQA